MKTSYGEWKGVTTNDNEWQQITTSSTTNENDTVSFKVWMIAIKHRNRHTKRCMTAIRVVE